MKLMIQNITEKKIIYIWIKVLEVKILEDVKAVKLK